MKTKETKLFFSIILLKLLLLTIFTSYYNYGLFQPFVDLFISKGTNPWNYTLDNNLPFEFPYHGLMLYILSLFKFISILFNIENYYINNFLFKLPLFISDIAIFLTLNKIFPYRKIKVLLFYFLNPIIIYAIYMHSQLDIIPTMFLFVSIYLLITKKLSLSAITLGFALATKIHTLIALPLILLYIYKTYSFKKVFKYIILSILILFICDAPFLFSDGFLNMVILNSKQSLIFDSFYEIGNVKILLPIASVLGIYFMFFNTRKINDDLLFFYIGMVFAVMIFFILPSPAWYVWLIPYISIFFIQNKNFKKSFYFYLIFSIAYLVFYLFFYLDEYQNLILLKDYIDLKSENSNLVDIFFTLLETILLLVMYAFYKYGIKSNSIYKKYNNLAIGIGGDSGVGKSSLLKSLETILGSKLLMLEGDGEHKWERGNKNWDSFTHLDPKANNIHKQADAIYELKHNNPIYRSDYDHNTGKFTKALKVEPREFIAISGLHPFYLPKLRKIIDLKIYMDTEEKLRRHWKILRDTKKRGYSIEKILTQIESRVDDTIKHIYPQKLFADFVIRYFSINEFKLGSKTESINLGLKITFDANIHIEDILEELDCNFTWDYNDDLKTQYLELFEEPKVDIKKLAKKHISNINELVSINNEWEKGFAGVLQLLILNMISEKLKD